MRIKRFPILLLQLVFLWSCGEDDPEIIPYPSLYHKSHVEAVGSFKVFSVDGEIKSINVINRLIRFDSSYYNYYTKYYTKYKGVLDTVEFFDTKHARLNHQTKDLSCELNPEGNLLVLTEAEVTRTCCTLGDVFTQSPLYKMVMITPEIHSEYINSSTGGFYSFGYTAKRKFVVKKSGDGVVAPLVQYRLRSQTNFNISGYLNNVLQPDFYKNLSQGDTLTMMECQVVFKK